jgi:hypothetical protein
MTMRHVEQDGVASWAWYSPCERYRYGLRRVWEASDKGELLYVMLNPSTATEQANDPTIERCQRRAMQLGFGGIRIANLFAYRATKPEDLRRASDPEGPENAAFLADWATGAGLVVAAWGVHGALNGQGARLAAQLPCDLHHLGLTAAGHPRHPLYVSYKVAPQIWDPVARARYCRLPDGTGAG